MPSKRSKHRRLKAQARSQGESTNGGGAASSSLAGLTNGVVDASTDLAVLAPGAGRREVEKDVRLVNRALGEGWTPTKDRRRRIRDRSDRRALLAEDNNEFVRLATLSLNMDKHNLDRLKLEMEISGLRGKRDPFVQPPIATDQPTQVNVTAKRAIFNIPSNGMGPGEHGSNGHTNGQHDDGFDV